MIFEIQERIGTLSHSTQGWSKQFNVISWNGREAKFDIRDWDATNEKMGRGISLTLEELHELKKLLATIDTEKTAHANA